MTQEPTGPRMKIPAPKLKMVVTEMATGMEVVNDVPMVVAQWKSGSFACVTLFPEEIVNEVTEGLQAAAAQVRQTRSGIVMPNGDTPPPEAIVQAQKKMRGEG